MTVDEFLEELKRCNAEFKPVWHVSLGFGLLRTRFTDGTNHCPLSFVYHCKTGVDCSSNDVDYFSERIGLAETDCAALMNAADGWPRQRGDLIGDVELRDKLLSACNYISKV